MGGASRPNRALQYAVLASLGLHALLLLGFPDLRPALMHVVASAPLIARLLEPPPEKKSEEPAARAKPVIPPVSKPRPAVPAEPAPAAPAPEPPARNEAPAVAAPRPVPPPPIASAAPSPAPAVPSAEAEMRSADEYRLELIATARRIKERMRYPPQAKENNWQGDVLLGVVISSSGKASITVKRSSQYEVLDSQAVEILRLAAREVSLPRALQGKESALKDLSFEYRLTGY